MEVRKRKTTSLDYSWRWARHRYRLPVGMARRTYLGAHWRSRCQYEFPSFRSILETLGLICGFLLPFALAAYFGSIGKGAYAPFIIFLGWAGTFYLAYKKDKKDRAEWQMRRDQAAITLFNAVRSGDQKEFAVFLRPFYTTDQIETVEESRVSQGSGKSETEFIHHPLEDTIVEAFRYTMPVVGLGKPGETFGVGRIFVDEGSWQSAASELMLGASLIICLPSSHPGSHWEMNQIILNNYLSKAVFIMPPDFRRGEISFSNIPIAHFGGWKPLHQDWDLLKQQMASNGITIPAYQADGLFFSLDAKGQCFVEKLHLDSTRKLLETFERLTNPVERLTNPVERLSNLAMRGKKFDLLVGWSDFALWAISMAFVVVVFLIYWFGSQ